MDIDCVYLNTSYHKIFLETPDMQREKYVGKTFKLKKAGLEQAGKEWYTLLSKRLQSLNWKSSGFDTCLFNRRTEPG